MKKTIFSFVVLIGIVVTSCKKDDMRHLQGSEWSGSQEVELVNSEGVSQGLGKGIYTLNFSNSESDKCILTTGIEGIYAVNKQTFVYYTENNKVVLVESLVSSKLANVGIIKNNTMIFKMCDNSGEQKEVKLHRK